MKRHELNFEVFPNNCLFGVSISQYETKVEETNDWHPAMRFAIGLIFITFSYTKISI